MVIGRDLIQTILSMEKMEKSVSSAIQTIGQSLNMVSMSPDSKRIVFSISSESNLFPSESRSFENLLILEVLKGSLLTYVWNQFARFDEEFALYISSNNDIRNLWKIQGVDPINAKIGHAEVDWLQMRSLQTLLNIQSVGLLTFSRLLGRVLLAYPYFVIHKEYIVPMPASFMFNFAMTVTTCPFIVSVTNLKRFLESPFLFNGISNKSIVVDCMHMDGSGITLVDLYPFWTVDGEKFLSHRNNKPIESIPCGSIDHLYDSFVRVVELIEHPLGVNGLIMLLEFVHIRDWKDNLRFVAKDVYKLMREIYNYNNKEFIQKSNEPIKIEIFDPEDWQKNLNNYKKVQNPSVDSWVFDSADLSEPIRNNDQFLVDKINVNFNNSSTWGLPN